MLKTITITYERGPLNLVCFKRNSSSTGDYKLHNRCTKIFHNSCELINVFEGVCVNRGGRGLSCYGVGPTLTFPVSKETLYVKLVH